jgi:hypothetical protein
MRTDPPAAVWTATDIGAPFAIEHARKLLMEGDAIENDYNYLLYRFGDPAAPLVARHYLGEAHVSLVLPGPTQPRSGAEASARIPPAVLGWLRQRFEAVQVLTAAGYDTISPDAAG